MYLFPWIQTVFLKYLDLSVASRVWDNFLIEGVSFLFRTGLAILTLLTDYLIHAQMEEVMPMLQKKGMKEKELWHTLLSEDKLFKVIEKTTKRPLVFAKRRMTLGLVTGQSKALVSARVTTGKQRGFISKIPKGTLMSSLINCNPTDDLKKLSTVVADRNYISAYQDFVAWFESANESGTETKLTIVTKMDFGSDIPKWAFMMAIGSSILKMMRSVVDHTSSNNL